jgi:glycosyltransferase involved in cell wall biosynthesis
MQAASRSDSIPRPVILSKDTPLSANATGRPWLSILIPVYNVLPYLEDCLSSVFSQSGDDGGIELILLDDRSTDGSADLAEALIARHGGGARLLRHADNRGLSAARNSMIEEAGGDYVWFLDSDDAILPGGIAALRDIVGSCRPDVVLCDYVRDDEKICATFDGPVRQFQLGTEALVAGVFARRRLHAWSRVWKCEVLDGVRFPEGVYFEDMATIPRLMLNARSYYYAAQPWIYYRSRPGSILAEIRADFDYRRNDELADALAGFREDLIRAIPDVSMETRRLVALFLAREYVKLAKRLMRVHRRQRSLHLLRGDLNRYREKMEGASPLPFAQIAARHARDGQMVRWAALRFFMALSQRSGWLIRKPAI